MNNIDEKFIYQIQKYIINIFTFIFIFIFNINIMTNEKKINIFRKIFFPKSLSVNFKNIQRMKYSKEVSYEYQIIIRQIHNTIEKLISEKIFRFNEITNIIIIKTLSLIE